MKISKNLLSCKFRLENTWSLRHGRSKQHELSLVLEIITRSISASFLGVSLALQIPHKSGLRLSFFRAYYGHMVSEILCKLKKYFCRTLSCLTSSSNSCAAVSWSQWLRWTTLEVLGLTQTILAVIYGYRTPDILVIRRQVLFSHVGLMAFYLFFLGQDVATKCAWMMIPTVSSQTGIAFHVIQLKHSSVAMNRGV